MECIIYVIGWNESRCLPAYAKQNYDLNSVPGILWTYEICGGKSAFQIFVLYTYYTRYNFVHLYCMDARIR